MARSPTMKLNLILFFLGICLVIVGVFLANSHTVVAQETGDAVRGGQLYDAWWVVIRGGEEEEMQGMEGEDGAAQEHHEHDEMAGAPEGDHPLWQGQDPEMSGGETWSCASCHGWDYQGTDGAPGLMNAVNMPAEDIVAILSGSTNSDHDFSTYLAEQDLLDLATFISEDVFDSNSLLNADGASSGDATHGEMLFGQVCRFCHGPNGNAINFHGIDDPEFVGHVAEDEPLVFIHKVRFGQPGWPMPSGINNGWSNSDVADVLAYAETLPTEPALSGGGPLYDAWWEALGVDAPEGDNALWSTQTTNTRSGADTWRCKECHGWDYRGADGAYGSGSHFTGFPGVISAAEMSAEDTMAWLTGGMNPDHDFSMYMDETALNVLVNFLQTETHDVTMYINDDGTVNGDPRLGRDLFNGTCANCHGVDGRTHNFGSAEEPEYIGTLASENPWEFFHKASYGQPGIPMPAGLALGWEEPDIADLLAYAQTLPRE